MIRSLVTSFLQLRPSAVIGPDSSSNGGLLVFPKGIIHFTASHEILWACNSAQRLQKKKLP